jgi:hypothetical protein
MMDFEDFILEQSGDTCVGALVGTDEPDDTETQPVWILSSLFMKNVVTVFDLGTPAVGFGRLKATNEQFGEFTVVQLSQRTALGTGPSASLSPTIIEPTPTGSIYLMIPLADYRCCNHSRVRCGAETRNGACRR